MKSYYFCNEETKNDVVEVLLTGTHFEVKETGIFTSSRRECSLFAKMLEDNKIPYEYQNFCGSNVIKLTQHKWELRENYLVIFTVSTDLVIKEDEWA